MVASTPARDRGRYSLYWHYDILGGLQALAELGALAEPRCRDALDLLESKLLIA